MKLKMIKKLVIISYFVVDTNKYKRKWNSAKIEGGLENKQRVWNLPKHLINGGGGG